MFVLHVVIHYLSPLVLCAFMSRHFLCHVLIVMCVRLIMGLALMLGVAISLFHTSVSFVDDLVTKHPIYHEYR